MTRRGNIILVTTIVAVVAATAIIGFQLARPSYEYHLTNVTGKQPDLELFGARGTDGQVRTASDYSGQVTILYFGYTHCPNICPTTLAKLHEALSRLDDNQADKVRVLFATVDPERDSLDVMKQYTRSFDPRFRGLRATGDALEQFESRYHISVEYGDKGDDGNYTVNHSSGVFVFDGQGVMRLIGSGAEPLEEWVPDLRHLVAGL